MNVFINIARSTRLPQQKNLPFNHSFCFLSCLELVTQLGRIHQNFLLGFLHFLLKVLPKRKREGGRERELSHCIFLWATSERRKGSLQSSYLSPFRDERKAKEKKDVKNVENWTCERTEELSGEEERKSWVERKGGRVEWREREEDYYMFQITHVYKNTYSSVHHFKGFSFHLNCLRGKRKNSSGERDEENGKKKN